MNYTTSRNYEELWRLVQEGKEIVCFSRHVSAYVAIARKHDALSEIFSIGMSYVSAKTKRYFKQQCKTLNLEFLPPSDWIRIENRNDFRKMPDQDVTFVKDGKAHSGFIFEGKLTDVGDVVIGATHWKPLPKAPEVGE